MFTINEYILIRIRPNKVYVENLKTGEFLESDNKLSFGNDRLLVTDTVEPESTLKDLINKLTKSTLINYSRTIIINPYHPGITKFTEFEKMHLRDMAEKLGARIVRFKFGIDVSSKSFNLKQLDSQTEI